MYIFRGGSCGQPKIVPVCVGWSVHLITNLTRTPQRMTTAAGAPELTHRVNKWSARLTDSKLSFVTIKFFRS